MDNINNVVALEKMILINGLSHGVLLVDAKVRMYIDVSIKGEDILPIFIAFEI